MIPIKDNVPSEIIPVVLRIIIVINIAAFIFEMALTPQVRTLLFHLLGIVPARYFFPDWASSVGYPAKDLVPFVSYMFLHGSFLHIAFNMWTLWVFADNVEDATGHMRFLIFYLLCGIIAGGIQLAISPESTAPIIGASGAIAGIMGAYLVLYPHSHILTLFPIIIIPYFIKLPAALFLIVWFLIQLFSGIFAKMSGDAQSVAWGAHIGGFIAGAILIRLFVRKDRCKYCYNPEDKNYDFPEDF